MGQSPLPCIVIAFGEVDPPAREETIAPRIATKAARRSSEEKTRRQRDGVNVEVRGRFVIIGIVGGLN